MHQPGGSCRLDGNNKYTWANSKVKSANRHFQQSHACQRLFFDDIDATETSDHFQATVAHGGCERCCSRALPLEPLWAITNKENIYFGRIIICARASTCAPTDKSTWQPTKHTAIGDSLQKIQWLTYGHPFSCSPSLGAADAYAAPNFGSSNSGGSDCSGCSGSSFHCPNTWRAGPFTIHMQDMLCT